MSKKTTLAARQKRSVVIAAIVILLLAVAVAVASYFVSLGEFVDVDGTKYTVKQKDGTFGLFDENGYRLETTVEDDKTYFVTDIGTMVSVSETGKTSIYAVVDTDEGESVSEYQRLLIFPKIDSEKLQSLKITNETGTYSFVRNSYGKIVIKGYESVAYNEENYAYLSGFCSSLVAMEKYPAATVDKYGLAEYGLDEPVATFTISAGGGKSYTIEMGDPIVSGNGYYVRLAGRNTVYIINSYYSMLFSPVETFVEPRITYGLTTTNYAQVYNFQMFSLSYDAEGKETVTCDTALTFWPLDERVDTEYQTQVYKMMDEALRSYIPNTVAVTDTMLGIAQPKTATVVKLGVNEGALKQYGLDTPKKILSFEFKAQSGTDVYWLKNQILFSEMTENRTHYLTARVQMSEDGGKTYYQVPAFDMILEMDRSELPFMDWSEIDWVERYYFHRNIMVVDSIEVTTPTTTYLLKLIADEDDVQKVTATFGGKSVDIDVDEFKVYYRNLLYGNLYDSTGLSSEEHAAITEKTDAFQYSYRIKTKVNDLDNTYAFYRLSETKSYLTIDGGGEFYVLSSFVNKYVSDIANLVAGIPLVPLIQN